MTKDQIRNAITKQGLNPDDLPAIKKYLAIVLCDNDAHFYNNPDDTVNRIIEIDYTNELIQIRENYNNFMVDVFKPFDIVQALIFYSNEVNPTNPNQTFIPE